MTSRERAIEIMKKHRASHVIYGYRAHNETIEGEWEAEMLKFWDDDSFAEYADKMQAEIDGLEMILAVHSLEGEES